MILEKNVFVERVLPGSVIRRLSEEEMAAYRRPFANPGEDRRPTLTWPRMIPIEGKPADVMKVVKNYAAWLADTDVAKLFINADPGSILVGRQRELCRAWPNQNEVTVQGRQFRPGRQPPMRSAKRSPTSCAVYVLNDGQQAIARKTLSLGRELSQIHLCHPWKAQM